MGDSSNMFSKLNSSSVQNIKDSYLFFRLKYPKFFILIAAIILAYKLFTNHTVLNYISGIGNFGYLGLFIAGMFFSFGFSAPFAFGFFIVLHPSNIFLASLIGGSGALVSDLLIFKFIRITFEDEFETLKRENLVKNTNKLIRRSFGLKTRNYLLYFIAGILIASPLPDEIGVTMLAGLTEIKQRTLGYISFTLNSLGILVIFYLSAVL